VLNIVAAAIKEASALTDLDEQKTRLGCYATLLGEFDGPETVDLLIDLLSSEHPEVRVPAGEELEALAFDRFKEVAQGIERALERLPENAPALAELPYLLAEVGEPGCLKLIGRFLKRKEAEVVASSIEALVELGDPDAIALLTPLERDSRKVDLEEGAESQVTVGELATEARELLAELADDAAPAPRGKGGR
jgi:HEAT repeat protein